jgi:hypothetical protein
MSDQYNYQYGGEQPRQQQGYTEQQYSNDPTMQKTPQQATDERMRQQDEQQRAERERNKVAQQLGDERPVEMDVVDNMIREAYANVDQPGLDPRNKPSNVLDAEQRGERPEHKSTKDLEDITGNPGHRGVTPYAPATSINRAPRADGFIDSINEPMDVARQQPQ